MSDLIDMALIMPEYPIPKYKERELSLLRMLRSGNIKEERKNKSNYI